MLMITLIMLNMLISEKKYDFFHHLLIVPEHDHSFQLIITSIVFVVIRISLLVIGV